MSNGVYIERKDSGVKKKKRRITAELPGSAARPQTRGYKEKSIYNSTAKYRR